MSVFTPFAFMGAGVTLDPDTVAFLQATGITNSTIAYAVNDLVLDLKDYGLWTNMDAIYPFVGGTANTHKYNLKNPQDTDAAYRIVWNGTITHSSTGVTPGGTTADFGDTKWIPNTDATGVNQWGFGTYIRTNNTTNGNDFGAYGVTAGVDDALYVYFSGGHYINMGTAFDNISAINTQGLFVGNRGTHNTGNTEFYKNGYRLINAARVGQLSTRSMTLFGSNRGGSTADPSNRETAFAYITPTGFSTTEQANLYVAVERFQESLGRSIIADADAQAFIDAVIAGGGSLTTAEQIAVNTLVTDLKAYSLWSKFDAVYPMVGGTATSTKYNLVDPQDTDGAFRLTFNGPWTYASTGITGDKSTTYADTHLDPATYLSLNDTHISYYSRTNNSSVGVVEMGIADNGGNSLFIAPRYNGGTSNYRAVNAAQTVAGVSPTSTGLFQANRIASGTSKQFRNGSAINTDSIASVALSSRTIYIGAYNHYLGNNFPTDRECAFASIGQGMTDAEAANFYKSVQAFQTILGRQV